MTGIAVALPVDDVQAIAICLIGAIFAAGVALVLSNGEADRR